MLCDLRRFFFHSHVPEVKSPQTPKHIALPRTFRLANEQKIDIDTESGSSFGVAQEAGML